MERTFEISDELIDALRHDDQSTAEKLISSELLEHRQDLAMLLEPYRTDKIRGTISDDTIEIPLGCITFIDDSSGTVHFEYLEEAYYGCRDMDKTHDHYDEQLSFSIDVNTKSITLSGMDEHERDPDEP